MEGTPSHKERRAVKGAFIVGHELGEARWDRCIQIPLPGSRMLPVCSRCLGLYGVAVVLVAILAPLSWLDPWGLWILPLPALVEAATDWWGLRQGTNALRLGTGAVAGVALARLLERYFADPGDVLFWAVIAAYGGLGVLAWIAGHLYAKNLDKTEA